MFSFVKGKATEAAAADVPLTRNDAPESGEVQARFDETWGYEQPVTEGTFYDRFAKARDLPMLLDTGALYDHSLKGAAELTVKQGWWRQVIAAVQDKPLVEGITFLETNRREPEAGNRVADWRDTAVRASPARSAPTSSARATSCSPVTERVTPQDGAAATNQQYDTGGDQMAWIVWLAVGLAAVFLLSGLFGRLVPSWRYPTTASPGARPPARPVPRGFIILAVVITHIEIGGPYSYITLHAVGAITGPRCSCSCPAWSSA